MDSCYLVTPIIGKLYDSHECMLRIVYAKNDIFDSSNDGIFAVQIIKSSRETDFCSFFAIVERMGHTLKKLIWDELLE